MRYTIAAALLLSSASANAGLVSIKSGVLAPGQTVAAQFISMGEDFNPRDNFGVDYSFYGEHWFTVATSSAVSISTAYFGGVCHWVYWNNDTDYGNCDGDNERQELEARRAKLMLPESMNVEWSFDQYSSTLNWTYAYPWQLWLTNTGDQDISYTLKYYTGQIPEPASWALMIAGFGLVGAAARRRGLAAA